jgi:hypothetical protein
MDMRDGRIDDGRLGRTANLREVGEEGGQVEEATVEGLAALALDGVVGGPALGSVGPAGGFAFDGAGCAARTGSSGAGGGDAVRRVTGTVVVVGVVARCVVCSGIGLGCRRRRRKRIV